MVLVILRYRELYFLDASDALRSHELFSWVFGLLRGLIILEILRLESCFLTIAILILDWISGFFTIHGGDAKSS